MAVGVYIVFGEWCEGFFEKIFSRNFRNGIIMETSMIGKKVLMEFGEVGSENSFLYQKIYTLNLILLGNDRFIYPDRFIYF